jgi:hypothetical protein
MLLRPACHPATAPLEEMPKASLLAEERMVALPDPSHLTAWDTSESSRLEPAALQSGATATALVMWKMLPMPSSSVMVYVETGEQSTAWAGTR